MKISESMFKATMHFHFPNVRNLEREKDLEIALKNPIINKPRSRAKS